MRIPNGLRIDSPSWPLLQAKISYWGISDSAGAADGTTLVCADLANQPSYQGHLIKILSGDAAGQTRKIVNDTTNATGTIIADFPFTDSAGNAEQITSSTRFVIISDFENDILYYGTATAAGAVDGSTIIDTGLATPFTVDDEPIGHTIRILTSSDATLVGQEREIYDYDFSTTTLVVNLRFVSQVPINTTYIILRNRPTSGGGPIPPPEPSVEETIWRLADYDNFDVADATADTERWSSEYQVGAAHGSADINTTTAGALHVNITAAAVLAAAQYGVRRLWRNIVRKFFILTDITVTVTNPNANHVWAGLAISRGIAWDANNYIAIYKRQNNVPVEGIAVEYNLAGAGVVTTAILATTQDGLAFKIERENTMWRCYYSLTQAPRHYWILALEIEDPTNSLTDTTSTYLTIYNPENAVGQQIAADFHWWEYYETLGNLGDIINLLSTGGGTFTTDSATVPADTGQGAKATNYFKGCLLIPLTGVCAFQPRLIVAFTTATGVFTLDAEEPFTAAPGLVTYVIVAAEADLVPAANGTNVTTTAQVIGNKADAATLDNMTALATATLVAEVKRTLLRMSPDAFTADIQGAARTELDTMLAQLATYFVAAGAAMALQVNGNVARTNLQQALTDFFAAFGCDGANVFNPTIQGAARTDLDTALYNMATYFSAAGAAWSVQINGNAARTNLEQVWEDFSAVFGANGANVFNPTIQGAGQTDLDAALAQLAIYFAAAGAAMSIQVQGGAARANLELVLEDYFAVVGCDGANLFNPTIQGATRTTFDTAFAALATYISASGAAYSASVNPGGAARDNIEQTLEDLGDMLAGATGIVTFPAAAAPANAVSLAEIIRFISDSGRVATVYTASASTVTSITAAALADIAGSYVGQMVVPLAGNMQGQGMIIIGYDGTSVLTVDPGWAQAPGNVAFAIVPAFGYILTKAIFDMVNGILTTKETGTSLTTDGNEQTTYINNSPVGVYKPLVFKIDCTNMIAGDEIHARIYYRIVSGGNLIKEIDTTLTGAQDPDLKSFTLSPNRFGVWITVQRTAGVDRAYQWAIIYED